MVYVKKEWHDIARHGEDIDRSCRVLIEQLRIERKKKDNADLDKMIKTVNSIIQCKANIMPFIKQYLGLKELYEKYDKKLT